jgi:MFS transporter, DHA3 family, multidrug efflux protein
VDLRRADLVGRHHRKHPLDRTADAGHGFDPGRRRDRANGLVGTTNGVSFLVTSVISGLLVAAGDMFYVLLLGMVVLGLSIVHLAFVRIEGRHDAASRRHPSQTEEHANDSKVDLRGTLAVVRGVPGLLALIGFSCFNNFLGGAFMALMDAYGLSMMSVQAWGLLWGALSAGFIVGGLAVAKTGLSDNPVRLLLLVNVVLWSVTCVFPLRSSVILLSAGMTIYMVMIPYAEASEQTILQKVVPYERQGRVFGFAQSVEQAASPLTAFFIGPITQLIFVPFMTDGAGAQLIGPWFGTGPDRGIALVFVLTGMIGLCVTVAALRSRPYRQLTGRYAEQPTLALASC